jgi:two-component system response regulator VicR
VETEEPDIVILDLGLPDISGFEVLSQTRLFSHVPIIILTVRADESDVVKGLEWGADDYILKPFRQLELLARVKALIRRQTPSEEETIVSGQLQLESTSGQVHFEGREIALTITESRILAHLMRNAGHVVTHSSLAEAVWGNDYPGAADSLKVHIRRLREKIEPSPSQPKLILTKAGVGYFLARTE